LSGRPFKQERLKETLMRMSGIAALLALILAPGLAAAGEEAVKLPPRIQTLQRPCEELLISRELTLPRLRGLAELNRQIETEVRLLVGYDAVDARILDGNVECEGDWEFAYNVTSECLATLVSADVVSIRCTTDFGAARHPVERQSISFIRSGSRFVPVESSAFFPDEESSADFFQLVAAAVLYEMNGSDDGDPYEEIDGKLIEAITLTPAGLLVSISHETFGTWVPEVTIPLEMASHLLEPKLVALVTRGSAGASGAVVWGAAGGRR
jgi:hypothetical protein